MLNIFKSKRAALFDKKSQIQAEHERAAAEFAAALELLKDDACYKAWLRALEIQRDIKILEERQREATTAARRELAEVDAELWTSVGKKIRAFLNWAENEKSRVSRELSVKGIIERDRVDHPVGRLITNAPKVHAHVAALNAAIDDAKALAVSPTEDLDAALEKIRAAVPLFDGETEQIDVTPGLASALS
jgi:hypothetical protein